MTTAMAEKRHEMLQDIADHMSHILQGHGIGADVAAQSADAVVDHLAQIWGGSLISIPKDHRWKISQRDQEILSKFDGRNHHSLAIEYGMTENAIYKLIKRVRDRRFQRDQGSLDLGDGC